MYDDGRRDFMDKRFLKKVYGLPNSHKMQRLERDCRRYVIYYVMKDSGYECKDVSDVWAFDGLYRPDWQRLYGPAIWPASDYVSYSVIFGTAPDVVVVKRRNHLSLPDETWTQPIADWTRSA